MCTFKTIKPQAVRYLFNVNGSKPQPKSQLFVSDGMWEGFAFLVRLLVDLLGV